MTPVIPLSGLAGWRFLDATYDDQLERFAAGPAVQRDADYLAEKFSQPVAVEDFLDDARLRRTALTAFGLGEESWKRGFIGKVLNEAADPDSTFLARLNNPAYSRFAEALTPGGDGMIRLSPEAAAELSESFTRQAFQTAVGETSDDLRLSLHFKDEIARIAEGGSQQAQLYRVLASVPVRTVLEGALNLPEDIRQLDIDRQASIVEDRLAAVFGSRDVSALAGDEAGERALERFHAARAAQAGPSQLTPGYSALALLGGGFGTQASAGLFSILAGR